MNRIVLTAAAALGLSLALAACATTPGACDPAREDFFKNTSCLTSGAYRQREQNLQAEVARERRRNASFRIVLEEVQAEQAQTRGTLRSRQAAQSRLDAAWGDLKADLAGERRRDPALAERVQRIDRQMQERKAPAVQADPDRKRQELEDLKRQIRWMQSDLEAGY